MKIKLVNVSNFVKKSKRFGFFIPFSNFLLVHTASILPYGFLEAIARRRNKKIEEKVMQIVGPVKVSDEELKETGKPKIWMVWFTGEENLPPLQKMCVESVKRNANGHEVVVLSLNNYKQYIEIPPRILELYHQGILNPANLADVIRIRLLSRYGGFWIDSTVYVTKPISEEIFKAKLYSMKMPKEWFYVSECRWAGFCFYMNKSSLLPHLVDKMLMKYWEKETWIIDYFLFDYLIDLSIKMYPSVKEEVEAIPFNNPNLHNLCPKLCDSFSAEEFDIMCRDTSFFKLSWKVFTYDQLNEDKGNYYHYLLQVDK